MVCLILTRRSRLSLYSRRRCIFFVERKEIDVKGVEREFLSRNNEFYNISQSGEKIFYATAMSCQLKCLFYRLMLFRILQEFLLFFGEKFSRFLRYFLFFRFLYIANYSYQDPSLVSVLEESVNNEV